MITFSRTILAALVVAAVSIVAGAESAAAQSCAGTTQAIGNQDYTIVKLDAIGGRAITGVYQNEGRERPHLILDADGTGIFEMHTQQPDGGIPVPITWYVVTDCEGAPLVNREGDWGKAYLLAIQWGQSTLAGNYPPGNWALRQLSIAETQGRMVILDRSKPF